jgi:transposase-like protein
MSEAGRIRLHRVEDVSAASLLPFIQSAVAPAATVHTDGWKGYAGLGRAGFKHRVSVITASPDPAHVVMPRVHRVAALLKRWLLGTHQGGVKVHQLDYYLDEFTFRFNRRRSKARGLLFHRLAEQAAAVPPAPYHAITGKPANLGVSEERVSEGDIPLR